MLWNCQCGRSPVLEAEHQVLMPVHRTFPSQHGIIVCPIALICIAPSLLPARRRVTSADLLPSNDPEHKEWEIEMLKPTFQIETLAIQMVIKYGMGLDGQRHQYVKQTFNSRVVLLPVTTLSHSGIPSCITDQTGKRGRLARLATDWDWLAKTSIGMTLNFSSHGKNATLADHSFPICSVQQVVIAMFVVFAQQFLPRLSAQHQ